MRKQRQNVLIIKHAIKSHDSMLPLDVADYLIKYMTDNKISISDMADRLKMEERLIKKFWLRAKTPSEGQAKIIMMGLMNG